MVDVLARTRLEADATELAELYARMVRIRMFEGTLLKLFSRGKLRGTVHTCLGQEACAVGVVGALDPVRDTICSNHRGHGHFIAFTGDLDGLMAEICGMPEGICGGAGGSQHLYAGNFYSNGILGGMVPVATGMALAHKQDGKGGVAVVFSGDGATAEGVVYEALNMAALWSLPLLLVVEHNQVAQSTPWLLEHGSPIEGRPPAFGVETRFIDGNDVQGVLAMARSVVARMREDRLPRCLVLNTGRLGPHSKGDDNRSDEEMAAIRHAEPLARTRAQLEAAQADAIEAACRDEIEAVLARLGLG